ncbi:MAG: PTS sugar transporter subunit IIA [Planctomycetota bacterium]
MKFLYQNVSQGSCLLNLEAASMDQIVSEVVDFLVQTGRLPESLRDHVVDGLIEREKIVPTVIGHACAVPHFYDDAIEKPAMVFVRLKHALNLGAPDGVATRYVFLMLGDHAQTEQHLDSLSSIARLMSDNVFHFETTYANDQKDVLDAMERHSHRNVMAASPKPRQVSEGLRTRAVPFSGMIADIQRRWKHYRADFIDGLRVKSIASIVFMFFACLAPAVTFGGLMGLETEGAIGAPKMLLSTAVCGVIYAVFSGSPLVIMGGIGPMLIFTIILYQLCRDSGYGEYFLGVYGWVGIWTAVLMAILGVTNASNLMKYFTRFTDEIFSALMSLIFIYKAVQAVVGEFQAGGDIQGNVRGLLALVLAIGTFYVAMTLIGIRKSKYLFPWMREFLADFGPSIALLTMISVAWWLGDSESLKTLSVNNEGGALWGMVDLMGVPTWLIFASIGPAMLATVLIYLSQNITVRLVNSPENKLDKGDAYHWDLVVSGGLVGFASLFGWPWMAAATVRSLAHVRALADVEEVVRGDSHREEIIHVNENRITPIAIYILIGMALLVTPLLEYIPMACLYGIFLYMGFVSLRGIQFIERIGYLFMDRKLYPVNHYTRRVPTRKIHLFTGIQLVCLVLLCVINVYPNEIVRILFPVFIALLVPVRFILDRFFEKDQLAFLDADEVPEEEGMHWV